MRDSIDRKNRATNVEQRLSANAQPQKAALPLALPEPARTGERIVLGLLALMTIVTIAGLGILAIIEQISSGRDRAGKEVVLAGSHATWFGVLVVASSVPLIALFVQQLPKRTRKGAFLVLLVVLLAAIVFAFKTRSA